MFPNYSIRFSKKAKYVHLTIKPVKGLEVVLPIGVSADCIPDFLKQKSTWINKHLTSSTKIIKPCLPELITLQSFNIVVNVNYLNDDRQRTRISESGSAWTVKGNTMDEALVQTLLIIQLKKIAKKRLSERINYWSKITGHNFNQIKIRGQKTRWGSCSGLKNISLNYKLLFLPKNYVDYVLLHELTHTKHMNHSEVFWRALEKNYCYCRNVDKEMKNANKYLPKWLEYNYQQEL